MAKQRNKIEEIADVRSRQRNGNALAELWMRLSPLELEFEQAQGKDSELIRYFPVAMTACAESYFRLAIKELINFGEPFLGNAEKLRDTIKCDFSVLRAVHGKSITAGDFISHCVQLSSLDHINAAMSTLLGSDFLETLKTIADRWVYEVEGKPRVPMIVDSDKVYAGVKRTFELRHIICHEFASNYPIKYAEIIDSFRNTSVFLRAAAELVQETIYPGAPLTQSAMNIDSANRLYEQKCILASCCETVRGKLSSERVLEFDAAQARWEEYCDAWSKFEADLSSGGTIRPLLYCNVAMQLTKQRIAEVQSCTCGDLS